MKKLLTELSSLGGISGFEETNAKKLTEILNIYCDECSCDVLGNFIGVIRCGKENADRIMLTAHTDGIGFVVTEILDGGFLRFSPIGGIDAKILPGCDVWVWGEEKIAGVIGAKPPHLMSAEDMNKAPKLQDMLIDTGLLKDELLKKVKIGDMVTFYEGAMTLLGETVCGKYLDDRAGVVALLLSAKEIREKMLKKELSYDIYLLLSSQEEVGTRGAAVGAYSINPAAAIVVDVTHGKTPDSSDERSFKLGSGVAICTGPNISPYMYNLAVNCAKKSDILYETEVEGGPTGTDAEVVQVAQNGIPCALFSIPLKYMHTTVEMLDFNDVTALGKLISEMVYDFNMEDLLCSF